MPAHSRIAKWVAVFFWMVVIFMASTDSLSASHTNGFIIPFVLWLFPHMPIVLVGGIHLAVRKLAHLAEYGILGMLLWRAIPEHKTDPEVADWWRAGTALLVATFYAATDEYHQSFVPSRGPSVHDVMINACGAGIAITVICLANRQRARRLSAPTPQPAS